jgi:hypothetical protein
VGLRRPVPRQLIVARGSVAIRTEHGTIFISDDFGGVV